MSTIRLDCLLVGEDPSLAFTVQIAHTARVYDLKRSIKHELAFDDVDARYVDLYRGAPNPENLLFPLDRLSRIFADPSHTMIHVLVSPPISACSALSDDRAIPWKEDDTLDALTDSFNRITTIASKSPIPPQALKCAAEHAIYIAGPPIELFNPAFAYFLSKAFDPKYDVPRVIFNCARDLISEFALIHSDEDDRRYRIKSIFQRAIHDPLRSDRSADPFGFNIVTEILREQQSQLSAYLIVGKHEDEPGDRGPDPSLPAVSSFLRTFIQEKRDRLLRCSCPTFIIAHCGPWLLIMGGMITAGCTIQRLTDLLWVPPHSSHDMDQCPKIARLLYALRESIQRLDSWYDTIEHVTPFNPSAPTYHSRFFPSPDTYRYDDALVKFTYQKPLGREASCVTYLAKTIEDDPKDIVVKFVTSYGVDVHREMASAGFAPRLLYYGQIDVTPDMPSYGEFRMVVREYVQGSTLEEASTRCTVPSRFRTDLRRALDHLHAAGYVFGNLRQPNVVVTPDGTSAAQLIHFDWAGKEGEVTYPRRVSDSIDWPEGVKGYELIRKEHDLAMLESLTSGLPEC